MNKYELCYKDIRILEFEFSSDYNISKINNIYDFSHLPLGIKKFEGKEVLPTQLNNW